MLHIHLREHGVRISVKLRFFLIPSLAHSACSRYDIGNPGSFLLLFAEGRYGSIRGEIVEVAIESVETVIPDSPSN